MVETISVAAAGPLSREDIADLVTDLQRDATPLTWRHERQEEPDTLGPGLDVVTAVLEHGSGGIAVVGAGAVLDVVVLTVRGWFRARRSAADATVDITITYEGPPIEVKEIEAAIGDVPANIRVHIVRSE
ncbi:hypothetical protein [Actinomadura sp. 3N508]|uniref:hypothetical protein n=1 Tax=Actinomadura sp. 3N508 TaxID=3375153 RepID=UPI0037A750F1